MSTTHPFDDWDAAYVLGALSSDERRTYERHLEECGRCREAVAELAGMPALLARASAAEVGSAADLPAGPSPALLAGLLARARGRRRRLVAVLSGAAAAIVLIAGLVGGVVAGWFDVDAAQAVELSLGSEQAAPITAQVRLVPRPWGTAVSTRCDHVDARQGPGPDPSGGGYAADGRLYGLYITDTAGHSTMVSSWRSDADSDVRAEGSTDLAIDQMASVDIRSIDTGAVVLSARLPH